MRTDLGEHTVEEKLVKVTAKILGEEYTIRGRAPREHIERVARYVHERMNDISEAYPKLGTSRVAVLAAINMADELLKIREQYDQLTQLLEEEWSQRHGGEPAGAGRAAASREAAAAREAVAREDPAREPTAHEAGAREAAAREPAAAREAAHAGSAATEDTPEKAGGGPSTRVRRPAEARVPVRAPAARAPTPRQIPAFGEPYTEGLPGLDPEGATGESSDRFGHLLTGDALPLPARGARRAGPGRAQPGGRTAPAVDQADGPSGPPVPGEPGGRREPAAGEGGGRREPDVTGDDDIAEDENQ